MAVSDCPAQVGSDGEAELVCAYPSEIPSIAALLQIGETRLACDDLHEGRAGLYEVSELAGKLLWAQLIATGFPTGDETNVSAIKAGLGLHRSIRPMVGREPSRSGEARLRDARRRYLFSGRRDSAGS